MSAKPLLVFIIALVLFVHCSRAPVYAETLPRVLVVCTDGSECSRIVGALGGFDPSTQVGRVKEGQKSGVVLDLNWQQKISLTIFEPPYGGSDQLGQLKAVEDRVLAEKALGKPYRLVLGVGAAGGGSDMSLGDVVVYAEFEYLVNRQTADILPDNPAKISSDQVPFWRPFALSLKKGASLEAVPYNAAPVIRTDASCVTVTGFVKGDERKELSKKFACFQKNDYVTAVAGQKLHLPVIAVRVISDVAPLPSQAESALKDLENWKLRAYGDRRKSPLESVFYSKFKEIYLSQLYRVLPAVLASWLEAQQETSISPPTP